MRQESPKPTNLFEVLSTFAAGVHLFRTAVIYNTKAGLDFKGKTNGRKSKTAV
jgi:hypothetical protein